MEKVSKVVEHNNGLVELFKDFWVDIVSSFKHDIYQTIIQLLGFFSSIFLMLQDSLAYNKYLKLDDAFLQHIMPCIVGSAAYAFFFYKKDDLGHNKFMTFLLWIVWFGYNTLNCGIHWQEFTTSFYSVKNKRISKPYDNFCI